MSAFRAGGTVGGMTTRFALPFRLGVATLLGSISFSMAFSMAPTPAAAVASGVTAAVVDGELRITGTSHANNVHVRVGATNDQLIEVLTGFSRAPEFALRRPLVSKIVVDLGEGDDSVTLADTLGPLPASLSGGDGKDRLTGGPGDEVFLGGADADTVDGRGGADLLLLGSGDDQAVWTPTHGRDVVEGQTGSDAVTVDGTNGSDHVEVLANGSRLSLFRPGDSASLDAAGLERLPLRPLAGADTVNVSDLTGVPHVEIDVDLKKPGPGLGDAAIDLVEVAGTPGADDITVKRADQQAVVSRPGGTVRIGGTDVVLDRLVVDADLGKDTMDVQPAVGGILKTRVDGGGGDDRLITNGTDGHDDFTVSPVNGRVQVNELGKVYEATAEDTVINGLGGADYVQASGNLDGITRLTLDGGSDNDLINGAAGVELLVGGAGKDQVIGRGGADVLLLGDDSDTSFWWAGDGNDVVEGGSGSDGLTVFGDDAVDTMDVSAVSGRVRVTRNTEVVDLDDIERTSLNPRGGADVLAVRDISGTDLYEVTYDLAQTGTTPDGQADTVTWDTTNGNDTMSLVGDADYFSAQGLAWSPRIRRTDSADRLTIDTKAGLDSVTTTGLAPGTIQVTVL